MVRWYATTGLLRCYRLDDLVKSFPFIPTHIESYLLFHVKVYPYGRGIPTLKGKKVLIETDIASYERLSDSKLADIDCCFDDQEGGGGGGGGGGGSYHIVRNNRRYPISLPIRIDDNNVLDICNAKWYFNTFYALFCLPKHANYDNLNFHQLHEISSIVYQQHEEDSEEDIIRFTSLMKSIPSGHHARLTATAVAAAGGGGGKDRLTSPIDRVWKLINSTSKSLEVFHHAKLVLKEVLEYTSNNMMPKVEYSEQTRRTVIDYVVFTAMKIANHLLFVSMEKEEGEEVVVEEEEEEPRCRRVLLVDEESLVNEEDPTLLPLDREELIGSGGSLDYALFPEGVIIVRQSGDEGEQRNIVDDEEEYEEEEEEKEKYPFYVEETTFNLDDCGLCQLLGQIHDTMYVKVDNNNTEEQQQVYQQQQVLQQQQQQHSQKGLKRKLDGERVAGSVYSHVKVSRDKVIGILTTGHRVEVFSIRAHPATSTTTTSTTTTASTATATLQKKKKKIVEFHGRRTLKLNNKEGEREGRKVVMGCDAKLHQTVLSTNKIARAGAIAGSACSSWLEYLVVVVVEERLLLAAIHTTCSRRCSSSNRSTKECVRRLAALEVAEVVVEEVVAAGGGHPPLTQQGQQEVSLGVVPLPPSLLLWRKRSSGRRRRRRRGEVEEAVVIRSA
eukprot:scaffold1537_cov162-Ochromonas_danica.AAC.15